MKCNYQFSRKYINNTYYDFIKNSASTVRISSLKTQFEYVSYRSEKKNRKKNNMEKSETFPSVYMYVSTFHFKFKRITRNVENSNQQKTITISSNTSKVNKFPKTKKNNQKSNVSALKSNANWCLRINWISNCNDWSQIWIWIEKLTTIYITKPLTPQLHSLV